MNIETQEHLTTLRNLLNYRIHELNTELHALKLKADEAMAEHATNSEVSDRKDEADHLGREQLDAQSERIEREELRRCEDALRRLDVGVYGDCLDCEEPIPLVRLLALPDAERCVACQARFERREQGHSHAG